MNIFKNNLISILNRCEYFIGAMIVIASIIPSVAFSQTYTVYTNPNLVVLGTAGNYRALSGTTLNIASGCTVTGNVGGIAVTNGGTVTGTTDISNGAVTTALNDLTTVKNELALRSPDDGSLIVELAGKTLGRGVYAGPGTFGINGTLTLDGGPGDIFIFKTTTTLITGSTCIVNLTGGALASNVYWQIGSAATINGDFKGNILAGTYITQVAGTIDGRTLGLTAVTLGGSAALPVELTTFTVVLSNSAVELNWNTATEVNNYGFEIQKSTNKSAWAIIGFVQGHGNSNSPKEYSFEDKNLLVGNMQYRLKQIDLDGSFEYSYAVGVNFEAPASLALDQNYPNPFNPSTNISFEIPVKSNVLIKIYNVLGSEVAVLLNEEKSPGKYQVEFNASHFASGIYFYSLNTNQDKPAIIKKMILLK